MSKQSDAKEAQGYIKKAPCCGDCSSLKFDMKMPDWMERDNAAMQARIDAGTQNKWDKLYTDDQKVAKNLRCGIGGFAVGKSASCRQHQEAA